MKNSHQTHSLGVTLIALFIFSISNSVIASNDESITNLLYTEKGLAGKQVLIKQGEFKYKGFLEVGWNNRRVKIEETLTTNGEGVPIEFSAKGISAFGSKIDESFEWINNVARWNSTKDDGEIKEAGRRYYVPADGAIVSDFVLVKALIASPTNSVELFPSGTAHLKKLKTTSIANGNKKATVSLYAISGMDFNPDFAWYDQNGNFFAQNMGGFMRVIRDGFTLDNFDELTKIQDEAEDDYLKNIAKQFSHSYKQLMIQNVNLVDVVNNKLVKKTNVLIENGKIKAIGKKIKPPKTAETINGKGKTLIPGLWDMHGHLSKYDGLLNIAAGVTSVRDIGNNHDNIMQIDRMFNSNTIIGTNVYRAGFMDQESPFSAGLSVKSLEEALKQVDWFADNGYLQVKLYSSIDPSWVKPIADRVHNRGMRLSGHIPAFMTAEQAVENGYDEIQHVNMLFLNFLAGTDVDTRKQLRFSLIGEKAGEMDLQSKEMQKFIKMLADKRIVIDPTVATFRSLLMGENKKVDPEFKSIEDHLPPSVVRSLKGAIMNVSEEELPNYLTGADALVKMVKVLYDNNVTIVPGTDHIAGFTLQRELEIYAEAGIPNIEVLKIGSLTSAKVIGVAHKTGSITVGKDADLVLVDGDPTKDMSALRKTSIVFKGNNYYKSAELHKALGV
ncbi:MAG: amidohydrolase family protein, partial [Kangiellaceae bacterium]